MYERINDTARTASHLLTNTRQLIELSIELATRVKRNSMHDAFGLKCTCKQLCTKHCMPFSESCACLIDDAALNIVYIITYAREPYVPFTARNPPLTWNTMSKHEHIYEHEHSLSYQYLTNVFSHELSMNAMNGQFIYITTSSNGVIINIINRHSALTAPMILDSPSYRKVLHECSYHFSKYKYDNNIYVYTKLRVNT